MDDVFLDHPGSVYPGKGYQSSQVIHNILMVHIRPAHLTRLHNISGVAEILSRLARTNSQLIMRIDVDIHNSLVLRIITFSIISALPAYSRTK
jgi:hypothetical protein